MILVESQVVPGMMIPKPTTTLRPKKQVVQKPTGEGPGLELSRILSSVGINPKNCSCTAKMTQMNKWGVGGCNEHFNEIIGWMRDGHSQWGWVEKLKAAGLAVANGLAFQINPFDPFPGLISEAIRRAADKEAEKKNTTAPRAGASPFDADLIESQLTLDLRQDLGRGLSGRKFNASTIPWKDGYATAFRLVQSGNDNVYVSIRDSSMNEQSCHRIDVSHRLCSHRREDPRFFFHQGRWWLSIIGVQADQKWVAHQLYTELDDDLHAIPGHIWCGDYAQRALWEKNWGFFDYDGELYAVYSIHPHVVLKIDRSNATEISRHSWQPQWSGGLLRGGASPVLHNGEYYSFFHGRIQIGRVNYYTTGCYTFEARPPFTPKRITAKPILAPGPTGWSKTNLSVLFTCGAFLQNDQWVLTHGVHDQWTQLDWIAAADVERRLIAI